MFYKILVTVIIFSNVFCVKSTKEKHILTLESYLSYEPSKVLTRSDITNLLYDVQSTTDTRGRAVKISNDLFLTNNHVISNIVIGYDDVRLVQQSKRGEISGDDGIFEILYVDVKRDLALLKLKNIKPKTKPYLHLYKSIPTVNAKVSEFLSLVGDSVEHSGYEQTFGGRDLYKPELYIDYLGTLLLPPNSSLYEKKGFVLEFKQEEILEKTKKLPSYSSVEIVSTIPIYQGESGSPVFSEIDAGKYYMSGVSTKALSQGETVSTPGSPLGFLGFDRTVSFIVHRDAIEQFIRTYIKQLREEIQRTKK